MFIFQLQASIQHSHRCASVSFLLIFIPAGFWSLSSQPHLFLFWSFFPFSAFNTLIITVPGPLTQHLAFLLWTPSFFLDFEMWLIIIIFLVQSVCSLMCCSASKFLLFLFYSHFLVSCMLEFNSTCHVSLSWDYYQLCSHLFPFPSLPVVCI